MKNPVNRECLNVEERSGTKEDLNVELHECLCRWCDP